MTIARCWWCLAVVNVCQSHSKRIHGERRGAEDESERVHGISNKCRIPSTWLSWVGGKGVVNMPSSWSEAKCTIIINSSYPLDSCEWSIGFFWSPLPTLAFQAITCCPDTNIDDYPEEEEETDTLFGRGDKESKMKVNSQTRPNSIIIFIDRQLTTCSTVFHEHVPKLLKILSGWYWLLGTPIWTLSPRVDESKYLGNQS